MVATKNENGANAWERDGVVTDKTRRNCTLV